MSRETQSRIQGVNSPAKPSFLRRFVAPFALLAGLTVGNSDSPEADIHTREKRVLRDHSKGDPPTIPVLDRQNRRMNKLSKEDIHQADILDLKEISHARDRIRSIPDLPVEINHENTNETEETLSKHKYDYLKKLFDEGNLPFELDENGLTLLDDGSFHITPSQQGSDGYRILSPFEVSVDDLERYVFTITFSGFYSKNNKTQILGEENLIAELNKMHIVGKAGWQLRDGEIAPSEFVSIQTEYFPGIAENEVRACLDLLEFLEEKLFEGQVSGTQYQEKSKLLTDLISQYTLILERDE